MKLAVIGTGYVGLVTGACFSEYGNQVYCIDIDKEKIQNLKQGIIPIYEPGLEELVQKNTKQGRLFFTTDLAEGIETSNIIFIAIGTPVDGQGHADIQSIFTAINEIGKNLSSYCLIVTKSTVPVGTADQIRSNLLKHTKQEFDVASNPEFLREGHAIEDFMKPERIIVGADSKRAKELFAQLYYPFAKNSTPILYMNTRSSELVKYLCNSFLAMKIAFANEAANLCDILGANYAKVKQGLGTDERIGEQFLAAGIGYGGSCFPKDVRALISIAKENNYSLRMLEEVEKANEKQKLRIIKLLQCHFQTSDFSSYRFAIWGLAFKPNTDDMRDAPSITIVKYLLESGASLCANDPAAHSTAAVILGDRIQYTDMYEALEGADALLLLTEWPAYQEPDFRKMKAMLKTPIIFDGRNVYQPEVAKQEGFVYYGIGTNSQN